MRSMGGVQAKCGPNLAQAGGPSSAIAPTALAAACFERCLVGPGHDR